MKKKSATITLGIDDDNPTQTMVPGHVTTAEFNRLHKQDWDGDRISKSELTHEYWIPRKRGGWIKAEEKTKGAKPFTVFYW